MKQKSRKPRDELGNKIFFAGLIALLTGLAAVILYLSFEQKVEEKVYESIATRTEEVRIPLSKMNLEKVNFYSYVTLSSESVKFFLSKSADNKLRIAFDACRDCYKSYLGYGQSGKDIICIHCKRRIKDMDQKQDGCNPLPLKSTVEKDHIAIKVAALKEGLRYFQ